MCDFCDTFCNDSCSFECYKIPMLPVKIPWPGGPFAIEIHGTLRVNVGWPLKQQVVLVESTDKATMKSILPSTGKYEN